MSDTVWIALITAVCATLPATLTALAALLVALRNTRKVDEVKRIVKANGNGGNKAGGGVGS